MDGYHENLAKILHRYQRCWFISGHYSHRSTSCFRPHCSESFFLTARLNILASTHCPCPGFESPVPSPRSECLTLYYRGLTPDSQSFVLSSSLTGSHRQSSLCDLRTKIDEGVPLDNMTLVKNSEYKILSLVTLPRTHSKIHTHVSIYIYIYIYINMNAYYCATFGLKTRKKCNNNNL